MSEETERPKFKYMVEFPNKLKIYAVDEQVLSSILEKYGMSSGNSSSLSLTPQMRHEDKDVLCKMSDKIRCPDCASTNFAFDSERSEATCMNCGYVLHDQKQPTDSGKPFVGAHWRCNVCERGDGYMLTCRTKKGSTYKRYVSRSVVEEVYRLMKVESRKLKSSEIHGALRLDNAAVQSAIMVLRYQGRVAAEAPYGQGRDRPRLLLFKAVCDEDAQKKLMPI